MFTGIIQKSCEVRDVDAKPGLTRIAIQLGDLVQGLEVGASVAVAGVCLTAVEIDGDTASFDLIQETLDRSTLGELKAGEVVNIERSARFGDEVGGHLLSGHVSGIGKVDGVDRSVENNVIVWVKVPGELMPYVFSKGYIALNGVSLTVVNVDGDAGRFSVHLIPETLRVTTFGSVEMGTPVNVEVDAMTQAVVDTTVNYLAKHHA